MEGCWIDSVAKPSARVSPEAIVRARLAHGGSESVLVEDMVELLPGCLPYLAQTIQLFLFFCESWFWKRRDAFQQNKLRTLGSV